MPRQATCDCGTCTKCLNRMANRRFYRKKTIAERRAIVARRDPSSVHG